MGEPYSTVSSRPSTASTRTCSPGTSARPPELAVDEHLTGRAHDGVGPDDAQRADGDRATAHLYRFREREDPEEAQRDRDREDERNRRVVGPRRVVKQHDHADAEADQPGQGERAVRDDVRVDHEQRDAEQDEGEAGPRDR
jgi:hypothetical protein